MLWCGGRGGVHMSTDNQQCINGWGDMKFSSFDKAGMNDNSNEINTRAMFRREVGVDDGLLTTSLLTISFRFVGLGGRAEYLYQSSRLSLSFDFKHCLQRPCFSYGTFHGQRWHDSALDHHQSSLA